MVEIFEKKYGNEMNWMNEHCWFVKIGKIQKKFMQKRKKKQTKIK